MRIVCPACQAVYEVPEAALAASPRVKCAKCQEEWAPTVTRAPPPPDVPADPVPAVAAAFVPPRPGPALMGDGDVAAGSPRRVRLAADDDPQESATGALAAWAATFVLLIGLGWASYNWRDEVMHAWPASTRLYAAMGLSAPPM